MSVTENGVEVCLYPDAVLCPIPHTDRIAIDFGGSAFNEWKAPCRLIVKKLMADFHGVILWSVDPVLTPKGIRHISLWLMHDNDVTDLPVGKVIEQGVSFYQEGGWGANGPKTYAYHIHCNCAFGHTIQGRPNANGKYELIGSVWANDVFFLKGTETISKTGGLNWVTYEAPKPVEVVPVVETSPTVEPVVNIIVNEPVELKPTENTTIPTPEPEPVQETPVEVVVVAKPEPVTEPVDVTPVDVTPNEVLQEPTPEPVTPAEPVVEPTPTVEETPQTNTNETQTTHQEPVNGLYAIIAWLIRIILAILGKKQ